MSAPDRALEAVRRVRRARERDSRIGLVQARADTRRREVAAAAARDRLTGAPPFTAGDPVEFRAHASLLRALADAVGRRDEEVRTSRVVADEADRRWAGDRQAVRTVDLLLDRRAEERRHAHRRREATRLDELAAQGWLRTHRPAVPTVEGPPA